MQEDGAKIPCVFAPTKWACPEATGTPTNSPSLWGISDFWPWQVLLRFRFGSLV